MIKYKSTCYSIEIEKVEIVKETEKTVWFNRTNPNSKMRLVQERKESGYYRYFDTFDEAKNSVINRIENEIQQAQRQIQHKKLQLEKAQQLKEQQ